MRSLFRKLLAAAAITLSAAGAIQPAIAAQWSHDPSTQGMIDLFATRTIEGCNAPGGLQRITDRDEPNSAPFWCGTPPHCLREGTQYVDSCRYVPYCRREPRHDPNGAPGANGCRDPQDLVCVSSGLPPEGGLCLQTCWDGSRILFSQECPPPPPPPCDPLVDICDVGPPPPPSCATNPALCPPPPPPPEYCPDGVTLLVAGCPTTEYCPDGTVKTAAGCGVPATEYCPDGVTLVSAGCPTVEYCPDGSVKTAAGCGAPPIQYCPDGVTPLSAGCYCPPGTIDLYGDGSCHAQTTCADGTVVWDPSNCGSSAIRACSSTYGSDIVSSYTDPSNPSKTCNVYASYYYYESHNQGCEINGQSPGKHYDGITYESCN